MDAMTYQQQDDGRGYGYGTGGGACMTRRYGRCTGRSSAWGKKTTIGRRVAVKKVVDILMYLQARLRPDVGGSAAASLSDFYAAMFTMTLEASHIESAEGFEEVIACVRNVRDAWAMVALDPEAGRVLPRELRTREEKFVAPVAVAEGGVTRASWSA